MVSDYEQGRVDAYRHVAEAMATHIRLLQSNYPDTNVPNHPVVIELEAWVEIIRNEIDQQVDRSIGRPEFSEEGD